MRGNSIKLVFYAVLLSMLLLFIAAPANTQSETNLPDEACEEACVDQYSISLVKDLLELPEGVSVSFFEKRRDRLGDRAAIGLLKFLSEKELLEPPKLLRSLEIMRGAFSAPCLIEIPADRKPSVTLFLLRDLERRVKDKSLKRRIIETLAFVQGSWSTPCDVEK